MGRRWAGIRFPVLCYLTMAAGLALVVWLSATFMTRLPSTSSQEPFEFWGSSVLGGWVHHDGGWYKIIATEGYHYTPGYQSPVAFFPSYPVTMRLVGVLTGNVVSAGIVVTFLCGLAASVVFYRWCLLRLSPAGARLAVVLVLVYPYAWFLFGAVYADALFVLCVLSAFLLIEHDHPIAAGLVAAVATAARPTGIGVVVGLVVVVLERRGVVRIPALDRYGRRRRLDTVPAEAMAGAGDGAGSNRSDAPIGRVRVRLSRLRMADAGVLLSASGLLAWCWYLWDRFDDPLLFVHIEGVAGWDQGQAPTTWLKISWLQYLHHVPEYVADHVNRWPDLVYALDITVQGALVIACVVLLPLVVSRIGWPYAVFVVASVIFPSLATKDWQGAGRYVLVAFPVFAAVADWLVEPDRPRLRVAVVGISAVALFVLASAYARGYYLA